ncbi:Gamma-butyrobetaine dioxygenase [wastewater metagenome]|uniref:Gamma-butyrobetaine dioxygenase n=2 Tax=unclassified sequences TaxID=12908 RepID=A0A5B8R672_9ZZZZ|nr:MULTISPECIES: TauD/TfdA family dioxygenase [Arhodomonas]MCS4504153.1 TauD/TfdA family dioxygenase [Arhodomonas aquaeolei]QEA03951.1 gamma-butyrobetaine dioxygenase [uncultured organism]
MDTETVVDMGELADYADPRRLAHVAHNDTGLELVWDDGFRADFHRLWLRDHCACPKCRHPQTHERTVALIDLPETLPRPTATTTDRGALRLVWPPMGDFPEHISEFDPGWLRQRALPAAPRSPVEVETWDAAIADALPRVDHGAFMGSGEGVRDWLHSLVRYGFVLLENGPTTENEVIRVAERIGWPRETNFGRHFDVVSRPDPNNAAYTPIALEPHIDLPNWRRPPDFQLLYCLQNEAEGGASLLTDGFAVAEWLRSEDPESFRLLSEQSVDFRFQDEHTDLAYRAPIIGLDDSGALAEIRFNNWIRDSLRLPGHLVAPFYRAYRRFWNALRDPRFAIRFSLRPGQMVAFDNLRVLHGREAFDPSTGGRHLQGAYLDRDLIHSRLRVLERRAA